MQAVNFTAIQAAVSTSAISNTFVPSIDNITVFPESVYDTKIINGDFARLPLMIGSNDNEGTLLVALYPAGSITPENLTLAGYTCPAARLARARRAQNISAWQYRYLAEFPNLNTLPALGVFHSSEIPLVWGTYNVSSSVPSTSSEIGLSRTMQGGWSAFARNPDNGLTEYGWPLYQSDSATLIQLGFNNGSMAVFANSSQFDGQCAGVGVPSRGL